MKLFHRQQAAFDALGEDQCVFQNEIGNGKRVYVIGSNKDYWDSYLARGVRHGYELIRKGMPCHLYIDLDVDKKKYPSIKVLQIWQILEKWIDVIFDVHYHIKECDVSKNIQFSSNDIKGSMHVIYQMKNKIFKSNAHVGAFMRGVRKFISLESPDDMSMFEEKFVDMSIYTANRLFRMLGCSKYGKNRYLTNNDPYTYENWVKTKVQPLTKNSYEFLDVHEDNGSEPKYGYGTSGVVICSDKVDFLKPLFGHIEEEFNTKITRYHQFPLTQSIACNLKTKNCPWKGEPHSKNTLYTVINTYNLTYSIRCHSGKCKDHRHTKPMPDHILNSVEGITLKKFVKGAVLF